MTSHRDAGFTLIETLAALMLTAVMVSGLTLFTSDWLRGWRSGNLRAAQAQGESLINLRLVRDIEGALASDDPNRPSLVGSTNSLSFVHEGIDETTHDRIETVQLQSDDMGLNRTASGQTQRLTNTRVRFAYADETMRWADQWAARKLPTALRITPVSQNSATPLIIRLAITRPALCADVASAGLCNDLAEGRGVQRSLLDDNELVQAQKQAQQ